ncbi:MAG: fibrobacter succinogenes major paralogous domain-containing protein, partial [Bacteroidales bacterium]|nr:fibrobacter succinogenes major paralogous domain-containing protein [Bacteroidales bacterium]
MKKLNLILLILIIAGSIMAQTPQSFKYQAVARDTDGEAIINTTIGINISLISDNINGNVVYSETFSAESNSIGVFNVNIGQGNVVSGIFNDIDWGASEYFLKAAMDVTGGSNYIEMGTCQLLSVPYSLHTGSIYVYYSNDTLYIGEQYVVLSGGGTPPGTVTDYDGNVYETVEIGTQTWLKQNLRSSHYADGSPIDEVFAYEGNESYVSDYGRLYTWSAVMGTGKSIAAKVQGVCPNGWHVPSEAEGEVLEDYLGGHMVAGGKMKETGYTYWDEPNSGATDESGFSARG